MEARVALEFWRISWCRGRRTSRKAWLGKTPSRQVSEAENEATALRYLGQAHRDNRAVVRYELVRRRVEIGEKLMQRAPRPVLIRGEGGEQSALSTLLLARLLPQLTQNGNTVEDASEALRNIGDGEG